MAKFEFLGRLSDQLESPTQLSIPPEITTISDLRPWLDAKLDCVLLSHVSIRAIVNKQLATEASVIADTDEIVFYPPVGGG